MSNSAISITEGQIERINSDTSLEETPTDEPLIWLPGAINAHDHGRGLSPLTYGAPDAPLEPWLWDLRRAPDVDVYLSHLVAFGEMVRSGITSVVHNHLPQSSDLVSEARQVARAAHDAGLRLAMVVPVIDRNLSGYDGGIAALAPLTVAERSAVEAAHAMPPVSEQIAAIREIADAIDSPTVVTQYGPPGPQWLSSDGWAEVGAAAQVDERRIHTHLLETRAQRRWLDSQVSGGATQFFEAAGVLNGRLTIAHGVQLTRAEIAAFAEAGVVLALNTSSNLRLFSGQADGTALAESGLALGLGLDGLGLDDDADIWREIRLAQTVLGPRGMAQTGLARNDILQAVFSSGRLAVDGLRGEGLIEGASADLVGLSLEAVASDQVDPSPKVTSDLVLGRANYSAVRRVIVNGREVLRDGTLTEIDLPEARRELTRQARAQFEASPPPNWIERARSATLAAGRDQE